MKPPVVRWSVLSHWTNAMGEPWLRAFAILSYQYDLNKGKDAQQHVLLESHLPVRHTHNLQNTVRFGKITKNC